MTPAKIFHRYYKSSVVVLLFIAAIAIYSNTFFSPLTFDDQLNIIMNPAIRDAGNLRNIWSFWPTRFIGFITFALNYQIHELNVFGYHLVNLAVHLGAAILVWWFILLVFATPAIEKDGISRHSRRIALFAALIFLVHPIQTESVTYIFQRTTSLAALFYILALSLYIKSRILQESRRARGLQRLLYAMAWVSALASMFSKENAATLPLAIILCEFCFFNVRRQAKWKYAFAFLVILPLIPVFLFSTNRDVFADIQRFTHQPLAKGGRYFLTQFRVMMTYLRLLFVPVQQNLDYDYPLARSLFEPRILASIFSLSLIFAAALKMFSRYRLISLGIFWFFLVLLPESSIIPLKDAIFEHRLYLPMVGYSLFIVTGMYYLLGEQRLKVMTAALVLLVAFYAIAAYRRNSVWQDELTLWNDVVKKSPAKARSYLNRGYAYLDRKNYDLAIADFNKTINIDHHYQEAYLNRGVAFNRKGEYDLAIADFTSALRINPDYAEAYNNRGSTFLSKNEYASAISDLTQALKLAPNYERAYNLGNLYERMGRNQEALDSYRQALALGLGNAGIYNNLGVVYGNMYNDEQATKSFMKAIELNPRYINAYVNLGNIYGAAGNYTKAIGCFEMAARIDPRSPLAFMNLAIVYYFKKEYDQAVKYYNMAIELGQKVSPELAERFKDLPQPNSAGR